MIEPEDVVVPTSKLAYKFKDPLCERLYYRAGTTTNYYAFAWREAPKTLENHWTRETKGMSQQDKLDLLKACFLAADAQEKARRDNKATFRPKGIAPWFNSGGWGDGTIEKDPERRAAIMICKCGQPTHGPKYTECQTCMGFKEGKLATPYADLLRDYYKRHQINYDQLKDLSPMRQVQVIKQLLSGNKNILLDK